MKSPFQKVHGQSIVYRIFLTSPGDVRDERALARAVIEQIHTERAFRGRINLECIAWDLHDLYGNVWEWVEDDWRQNYGGHRLMVVPGLMIQGALNA